MVGYGWLQALLPFPTPPLEHPGELAHRLVTTGLDVATCGVANATSFYSVATKFSRLVANLATKIGDFLLWINVH